MGHRMFSSSRHPVRFVLDAQSHYIFKVHSTAFTECDTTNGRHHHEKEDEETASASSPGHDSAFTQVIGIAILEFRVVFF